MSCYHGIEQLLLIYMVNIYFLLLRLTSSFISLLVFFFFNALDICCSFDLFKPMHEMWKSYIIELLKETGCGFFYLFCGFGGSYVFLFTFDSFPFVGFLSILNFLHYLVDIKYYSTRVMLIVFLTILD